MNKVTIMRGISGSGKSTYIKTFLPEAVVCSADHFFNDADGNYVFDATKLGAAHGQCRNQFVRALDGGEAHVVVDNTNTTVKEMKFYYDTAKEHGYDVEVVQLTTPVDVASARNTHGVPREAVERMHQRMQALPSHWHVKEKVVG